MIAAIRTGDLDFSLSLWNTHFLSALRTLEDPMCFIRVLFSETVPDGRSQFQELLVFCLSARNISGKNAVVGIDKHRNGNQVTDGVCSAASACENGNQQKKQKHAEKRLVKRIVSAVSALHKSYQAFSPI